MSSKLLQSPKVTVVMTVFNGMPFLRSAVESVLCQSFQDFEMIVVDDGSTDGTSEYLKRIRDNRCTVIRQTNQGQQAASAKAISMAKGEFIARLDADDIAKPNRLKYQVEFLEENPSVSLVGTQVYRMGNRDTTRFPSRLPTEHALIYEELINNRHAMCHSSTMFRKDHYEAVGGYWEHRVSEDWDLFLRLGEIGKLANIDLPLTAIRFHRGSINGRRAVEAQQYNWYACERATHRNAGKPIPSLEEFHRTNAVFRFPRNLLLFIDCLSLANYRNGIARVADGQTIRGYTQLLCSALLSPSRTLHRVWRTIRHRFAVEPRSNPVDVRPSEELVLEEKAKQFVNV